MIKIKSTEIREFLKRSKTIKTSNLMPILAFVKLDITNTGALLSKTNLKSYCIHQIEAEGENISVLLDENLLAAIATTGDEVEIQLDNKTIHLKNGDSLVSFQKEDATLYPIFPDQGETNERVVIGKDVLQAIGIASKFVFEAEMETNFSFVHVKNNSVFSTDKNVIFLKNFTDNIPNLLISTECAAVISGFDNLMYFTAGNYDFYDTGKTTYGFIRSEYKSPDFSVILSKATKGTFFTVAKENIVKFCELATTATPSLVPVSKLDSSLKEGQIDLTFFDDSYNVSVDMSFNVSGDLKPEPFTFNPKVMLPFIKSLPYQELNFTPLEGAHHYTIWSKEDEQFTGIMAGHVI